MNLKNIVISLACFLMTYSITACTPYLAAPNEPNSSLVIGRVVVENNYPGAFFGLLPLGKLDKGLKVEIESRDGKQSFKVSTEEQGYFIIPNIGHGNYHILNVVIEGWRGDGDKEGDGITVRRPTFAPTPGKITYIGTLVIAVSDRGTSKIQEIKEPESASAYFRQKTAASAWTNREFVRSGQPLQATAAYPSGKIEKPEWKIGFEWRYAWKQAGRSGTFINEIVREEVFDGKPA